MQPDLSFSELRSALNDEFHIEVSERTITREMGHRDLTYKKVFHW
jgi:hypothetical protein